MLGHLLRCLYYREQRCHSGGWCKASWIAEVFGIHLRSVKAARKHLVEIGWLRTFHTPQRVGNRWGTYTLISLSWTRYGSWSKHTADYCRTTLRPITTPRRVLHNRITTPF